MSRETVLSLLLAHPGEYLSGAAMSRTLGVSRAAVWKAIEALRQEGYEITRLRPARDGSITVEQVEEALGVPVTALPADSGFDLVDAILGLPVEAPAYTLPPEDDYYRYNP